MSIIDAKKEFFGWLQAQFTDCEIQFQTEKTDPASTTWMRVWVLQEDTGRTVKNHVRVFLEVNFSLFTSDLTNIYTLDALHQKLSDLIERRRIKFNTGEIEFREFTSTRLTNDTNTLKNARVIQHESIMVSAVMETTK